MIEVNCHISIKKDGKIFLEPQKTALLQQIKECGSLSGAARNVQISYQHAWNLINTINLSAPEPLVIKQRGGANGGGAVITAYGEKILAEYKLIELQLKKLVSQINVEINM